MIKGMTTPKTKKLADASLLPAYLLFSLFLFIDSRRFYPKTAHFFNFNHDLTAFPAALMIPK